MNILKSICCFPTSQQANAAEGTQSPETNNPEQIEALNSTLKTLNAIVQSRECGSLSHLGALKNSLNGATFNKATLKSMKPIVDPKNETPG